MRHLHEHFRGFRSRDERCGEGHQAQERHRGDGAHGEHGGFGRGGRGPGFGRGFGMGRGPGGAMRMFASGDLRYVILRLIAEKPRHGYEIIKAIEEKLGGGYAPSPGVVYPMLTMLEEMGHATVEADGARKLYSATDEGRKALEANRSVADAVFERMEQARTHQEGGRSPQIERAVENFRLALRMKAGPLSAEQVHAITDIIDAAAKQIERL